MTLFRYCDQTPRYYPDIVIPGKGCLFARYGDEMHFVKPPDIRWVAQKSDPIDPPDRPPARKGKEQ